MGGLAHTPPVEVASRGGPPSARVCVWSETLPFNSEGEEERLFKRDLTANAATSSKDGLSPLMP